MPSRSEDIDRRVDSVPASFARRSAISSRRLEIGIGCGSRLGDGQDLGLQPLNELSVGFGSGMMLRDLLGVPGPLGLELGLEFSPEPGPLGLDGLEMFGLELIVQIRQLAQPGLKHSDFRPGRLELFPGLVVLFVQPASFIAMCLLGTDKGAVKLVDPPTQLFALLLKFLLAPGQRAAQLSRLGRVCLPQGGQPLELIELRGKLVVALTELLGKLVAPYMRSIQGPGMMGNSLVELIAPGSHIAELSLEVPKLLPKLVVLSMNAVQPVIELLDPLVELFGLETGQAYLFLAIRADPGKPKTGGQLGPQALHLVAQPLNLVAQRLALDHGGPRSRRAINLPGRHGSRRARPSVSGVPGGPVRVPTGGDHGRRGTSRAGPGGSPAPTGLQRDPARGFSAWRPASRFPRESPQARRRTQAAVPPCEARLQRTGALQADRKAGRRDWIPDPRARSVRAVPRSS